MRYSSTATPVRGSGVINRKKQSNGQADSNYQSYTDVSSISSCTSMRRPSPMGDAKPITNPELRRQLRLTNSSSTRLRPQDQKILELMLAKREEQMMENHRRDLAHRKWESERERSMSVSKRRSGVSADRKRDQNATTPSRQRPTSIDHRHSRTDVSKTDTPRGRHLSGSSSATTTCMPCSCAENNASCTRCRTPVRNQAILHKQLSEEKKQRETERKKRQEERLQQQRKNKDEYRRLLQEEQQRELKRAGSAKDVRAQEQQLKTKFRNFVTKKRQEEAISKKLIQESEEKELMKVAMAERLEQAEKKRAAVRQQREREHRRNNFDLHDRLDKTKQKKEQQEMEMEVYRTELQTYLQMQEKRAEELAREAVLKKKMKVHEGSIEKTALQRRNLEKLIEQEEEWKAEVEADIAMKESRMKTLQMEKDERIAQSRDLANTSRLLREQLRCHYSMNDLDQLSSHARLESRIHSPTYNMNNLTINNK
ncbi:hypothetical protein LSAT2_028596 [Lamellibrachia satsuma]|nr:hypothetical protein LSAT2_028596 [Lamellibrachia satsuma]